MTIRKDIVEYLRSGETGLKNIGVEIEHFVIDSHGNQIEFDEVAELIDDVVSKKKYLPDFLRIFAEQLLAKSTSKIIIHLWKKTAWITSGSLCTTEPYLIRMN